MSNECIKENTVTVSCRSCTLFSLSFYCLFQVHDGGTSRLCLAYAGCGTSSLTTGPSRLFLQRSNGSAERGKTKVGSDLTNRYLVSCKDRTLLSIFVDTFCFWYPRALHSWLIYYHKEILNWMLNKIKLSMKQWNVQCPKWNQMFMLSFPLSNKHLGMLYHTFLCSLQ